MRFRAEKSQITSQKKMAIQFTRRSHRDAHKAREFWISAAATACRKIRLNRDAGPTNLTREAINLIARKSASFRVN